MPQVINTNIQSLNAQRNLNKSQNSLGVSLQRLSSGLRINSAKDDAAGLAISNRMTAQIRGTNQAARNAADAISLAQTGEGGLQEITNNLQRMRELAIQSRNATNTASDRNSIDSEFQQLLQEVDRVAKTTSFNGRNVLDGSLGTSVFQVGANVGETVAVNVSSSMRTASIGTFASQTFQLTNELDAAAAGEDMEVEAGDISVNGTATISAALDTANGLSSGSAESIAATINEISATTGVSATASGPSLTVTAATIAARAVTDNVGADDTLVYTLTINGTTVITQADAEAATKPTATSLAGSINSVSNTTGVTATVNTADGSLVLSTADGRNIDIVEAMTGDTDAGDQIVTSFGNTITNAADTQTDVHKGSITLTSSTLFTLATTDIVADNAAGDELFSTAGSPTDAGGTVTYQAAALNASSVLTELASDLSIQRIDAALTDVDTLRGTFGAIQSRFESTISNLQTTAENVSAARSRIRDADFAEETAALTRSQVLQQAGISVLTQANAQPQLALALLQ